MKNHCLICDGIADERGCCYDTACDNYRGTRTDNSVPSGSNQGEPLLTENSHDVCSGEKPWTMEELARVFGFKHPLATLAIAHNADIARLTARIRELEARLAIQTELLREAHSRIGNTAFPALAARIVESLAQSEGKTD